MHKICVTQPCCVEPHRHRKSRPLLDSPTGTPHTSSCTCTRPPTNKPPRNPQKTLKHPQKKAPDNHLLAQDRASLLCCCVAPLREDRVCCCYGCECLVRLHLGHCGNHLAGSRVGDLGVGGVCVFCVGVGGAGGGGNLNQSGSRGVGVG